jgi:hypothetical protein
MREAMNIDKYFTKIPNAFLLDPRLNGLQFKLLLLLCGYAMDRNSNSSTPSVEMLALDLGCSIRQVQRLLIKLETEGYIKITKRPSRSSRYKVLWSDMPIHFGNRGVTSECRRGMSGLQIQNTKEKKKNIEEQDKKGDISRHFRGDISRHANIIKFPDPDAWEMSVYPRSPEVDHADAVNDDAACMCNDTEVDF